VPSNPSGAYKDISQGTLTGTGVIQTNSDPFFGVMMPVACSSLAISGELYGAIPSSSPAANYTLKVYKVTSSGGTATATEISALQCQMKSGTPTCAPSPVTGQVSANDIIQVQVSGNQGFNWSGGLYANLSCTK